MPHIWKKIAGIPYARSKSRGNLAAPRAWTDAVVQETRNLPKIRDACLLRITLSHPLIAG
jgi:hypothetical protein